MAARYVMDRSEVAKLLSECKVLGCIDKLVASADRILFAANGQTEASQQISDQLSRIRELREKLTELDRQLKEQNESASKGTSPGKGGQGGSNVQNGDSQQPWDEARSLIDQLRKEKAAEIESPPAEGFNPGRSAPGTEAWKQDFSKWETLKTQIAASLERAESSAAARLRDQQSTDRLSAGTSQAVPEQYRRMVAKYYEALASQSPKEKR